MKKLILFVVILFFAPFLKAQDILAGSDINVHIADSLYKSGDYTEALKYYNMVVITTKSDPDLFYKRARTYIKVNDISKAKRDLNRAARIGSYKSELLLDSIMGRTEKTDSQIQFEKDLEKYIQSTND
jgi:tetratricopeptide (TPR) repeat protein